MWNVKFEKKKRLKDVPRKLLGKKECRSLQNNIDRVPFLQSTRSSRFCWSGDILRGLEKCLWPLVRNNHQIEIPKSILWTPLHRRPQACDITVVPLILNWLILQHLIVFKLMNSTSTFLKTYMILKSAFEKLNFNQFRQRRDFLNLCN